MIGASKASSTECLNVPDCKRFECVDLMYRLIEFDEEAIA